MRAFRIPLLAWLVVLAASAGRVAHAEPARATVNGSATYQERVALPPEAIFEVTLEDVSHGKTPGEIVARVSRTAPAEVPIPFEFGYDPHKLDTGRKYVVRASILEKRRVRFTGTRDFSVPAPDRRGNVNIVMQLVSAVGTSQNAAGPVGLGDLPATFSGLMPCADCVGTRVQLNLLPAHAYIQRLTYLRDGSDQSYYDIGNWSLSEDGRTLTLDSGKVPTRWGVDVTGALRKLDTVAKPVAPGGAGNALTRSPAVLPLQPRLRLNGMFRYLADAPRFRDCRSGLTWPVDMGADYRALERAYAAQRLSAGAELKATVQGRIEDRPKQEGGGSEPTLVVEAFLTVTPGEVCEDSGVHSGLVNSRWCPVQIGEKLVRASAQGEAWITLDPKAHRFTGSAGCNRINGGFDVQGEALRFGRAASTMKACPDMDTERAFLGVLEDTRRYRASGRTLELLNGDGKVLARLEECNLH